MSATDTVEIHRTQRQWRGETLSDFSAYCLRCNTTVQSNAGRIGVVSNWSWRTKAPAVRAAREHLERHQKADRRIADGSYLNSGIGEKVVESVTLDEVTA